LKIDFREVGGQTLRVGIRPGDKSQPPLLLFNGIGANIELVEFSIFWMVPRQLSLMCPVSAARPRHACPIALGTWCD
jgi:hypothetical protein